MSVTDDWSLVEFEPPDSDAKWLFRKNLAPAVPVGDPCYPYLAFVTITIGDGQAQGMPSLASYDTLVAIEERALALMETNAIAVQIGAVLKPGMRDLLYYTRDPDKFHALAMTLRSEYSQFECEVTIVEDPSWTQYKELP